MLDERGDEDVLTLVHVGADLDRELCGAREDVRFSVIGETISTGESTSGVRVVAGGGGGGGGGGKGGDAAEGRRVVASGMVGRIDLPPPRHGCTPRVRRASLVAPVAAVPPREERLVFVVGSRGPARPPGHSVGAPPGLVDLGEVEATAVLRCRSSRGCRRRGRPHVLRRMFEVVRTLGLAAASRGVEQTPRRASSSRPHSERTPPGRAVHIVRDGRDVVCSLLERGWLGTERAGADDAGLAYGAHARFWVEPERAEEFGAASEAKRAAWAWRRYVTAAPRRPGADARAPVRRPRHEPEEVATTSRRTSTSKRSHSARSLCPPSTARSAAGKRPRRPSN